MIAAMAATRLLLTIMYIVSLAFGDEAPFNVCLMHAHEVETLVTCAKAHADMPEKNSTHSYYGEQIPLPQSPHVASVFAIVPPNLRHNRNLSGATSFFTVLNHWNDQIAMFTGMSDAEVVLLVCKTSLDAGEALYEEFSNTHPEHKKTIDMIAAQCYEKATGQKTA